KITSSNEKNCTLLHKINGYITHAKRCIIITGAVISCSGGIPVSDAFLVGLLMECSINSILIVKLKRITIKIESTSTEM
ncbi:27220_t:CDS:1, partial [Racocetra persica]